MLRRCRNTLIWMSLLSTLYSFAPGCASEPEVKKKAEEPKSEQLERLSPSVSLSQPSPPQAPSPLPEPEHIASHYLNRIVGHMKKNVTPTGKGEKKKYFKKLNNRMQALYTEGPDGRNFRIRYMKVIKKGNAAIIITLDIDDKDADARIDDGCNRVGAYCMGNMQRVRKFLETEADKYIKSVANNGQKVYREVLKEFTDTWGIE